MKKKPDTKNKPVAKSPLLSGNRRISRTETRDTSKQSARFTAEIEELRARLAEAEETLRAIRRGEVDALLVTKAGVEQVFTLKGAEYAYRVLVEEMNEGAATVNSQGLILFANGALASMLDLSLEKATGSSLRRHVTRESLSGFDTFMERCRRDRCRTEVLLKKKNGSPLPVLLSGRRLSLADVDGISIVVTDLSLQKAAEETLRRGRDKLELEVAKKTAELRLHQLELETQNEELRSAQQRLEISHRKFSDLYDFAPIGYFTLDLYGLIREVNLVGAKLVGLPRQQLLNKPFSALIADAHDVNEFATHQKTVFVSQGRQVCELKLKRSDGSVFYSWLESVPSENVDDKAGRIRTAVSDISERKKMEQALRQSEERCRTLAEATFEGITISENGSVIEANEQFARMHGYGRAEVIGKPVTAFLVPEDRSRAAESVGDTAEKTYEYHGLKKDGSIFFIEARRRTIVQDGRRLRVTAIRDISERKRAEEAIRISMNRFELLAGTAASLLQTGDPRRLVVSVCEKVMEYLGCDAFFNFLVDEKAGKLRLNTYGGIREEQAREIEWLGYDDSICGRVARDGCRIVAEHIPTIRHPQTEVLRSFGIMAYACYPLYGFDGRVTGTLSFGTRKRRTFTAPDLDLMKAVADQVAIALVRINNEEALRESETRYRLLVEVSPDAILIHDGETFLFVNSAAVRLLGFPGPGHLIGREIYSVLHPDFHEIARERLDVMKSARRIPNRELKMLRFDGTTIDVESMGSFMVLKGRQVFQIVIRDITERKRAEEKIIHQNALLEGINLIFQKSMACDTEVDLGRLCLQVAEKVTQSSFGFIGTTGAEAPLRDLIVSDRGRESCRMYGTMGHGARAGTFKAGGLYSRALAEGKSFFTNDPASEPDSTGLPEGHPRLTAFLAAPLIHGKRTIGMIGLGKRKGEYWVEDLEALDALAAVMVQAFLRLGAEDALHKNQEQLREYVNLLEYAPLMVRNTKEEIIHWNRGMQRMYGYSSAEAIGQKAHRLLKTRFPQPLEKIRQAVESSGTWEGEVKHFTRDRRTITVASLWVLHKNSDGRATAIIEIHSDITERRRAEEQLQRLNEELEVRVRERTSDLARTITTLQNEIEDRRQAEEALRESQFNLSKAQSIAHVGSWSYDLTTKKFVSSAEFYNIFGLDRSAKADIGTIVDIVHPDDRKKVLESTRELMSAFRVKPLDYRIMLPDSSIRVVWTEAEMVCDASGRPASVIGTVHDITERKRSEEEVSRLAAAVESAADALVVTDPLKGIIQYVNPAFEKITGYTRQEVVGRDLHVLESGSQDQDFFRKLREALKKDGVWTGRMLHKKKDGTLYHEECTYSPVRNAAGEIINYISIKRDVTEKVRLESIAHAVETMNNVGYIFAGVSHEIGNPINAVRNTLDIMQKKLDTLRKEHIAEYLDRAMSQIFRVEYLLKGLKNFNMYESLRPAAVKLSPFFGRFLSMVKKDFEAKGVLVETVFEENVDSVYADPRALQQVMLNILTNASDALEGREKAKIVIAISARPGLVRIRVKDNGRGIEENKLKDLFKPFYTTKKHGTGLGLVMIKKMTARMNGTVEIMSRINEGTTVELCLPAEKRETDD